MNLTEKRSNFVVADIGGTNARFGIVMRDGVISEIEVLPCQEYVGLRDAFIDYIERRDLSATRLALAVACPVDQEQIRFTNNHWSFEKSKIASNLGLEKAILVNDFTAQSLAVAFLNPDGYRTLQLGEGDHSERPILVIGPGTGLGVGGLVYGPDQQLVILDGEGGHVTVTPKTTLEYEIIKYLENRWPHVSAERLVSGPGLSNIYESLCAIRDVVPSVGSPSEISAIADVDPLAREALDIFASFFGTVASNACLTMGAGSVVIAGGVIPKLDHHFNEDIFLSRFSEKGRLSELLSRVSIKIQPDSEAALVGLANAFDVNSLKSKVISA